MSGTSKRIKLTRTNSANNSSTVNNSGAVKNKQKRPYIFGPIPNRMLGVYTNSFYRKADEKFTLYDNATLLLLECYKNE